jgi:hypothetical protein
MPIAQTMILATLAALAAGSTPVENGSIHGTVVNSSETVPSPCKATVMLRVQVDNQFVPFRETESDAAGRYRFDHLPVGLAYRYLIGANRADIHYPGPRLLLTESEPAATVQLSVRDAVTWPNPLVIRKFDITIAPEPGALRVTESLLVENPTAATYVGRPPAAGAGTVTLQLAVPSDFERTTFDQEFFGRRFSMVGGKLSTGVPWTPGQRELKYTYILRNAEECRNWQRPLDLPCDQVNVRVCSAKPGEIRCDLPSLSTNNNGEAAFASTGQGLPAGQVIHVTLGHLPLPWMATARWSAIAVLVALSAGASCVMFWRRKLPAELPRHQQLAESSPVRAKTSSRKRRGVPGLADARRHRR